MKRLEIQQDKSWDYPRKLFLPVTLNPIIDKNMVIDVYGDSFGGLSLSVAKKDQKRYVSWMYFVSQMLGATLNSYGLSAASNQTIYEVYKQTINNKRDAIIIFHSSPGRKDLYFGLPTLKLSTYEKWDLEFRVPVLHLYWSEDHKVYTFKNGISFLSLYHEVYGQQTCKWLHPVPNAHNWKYNPELQKFVIHHMDINGNFQLAMKVVDIFKKELYK
jgi:hypothetical protein